MQPKALAVAPDGNVYVGDASFNDITVRKVSFSNRGAYTLQTYARGLGWWVQALAADASGNLFAIVQNRIVRIAPDGTRTTLAGADEAGTVDGTGDKARFSYPQALAFDRTGLLYVADSDSIRTVTANGEVRTHLAATAALDDPTTDFSGRPIMNRTHPTGLAFDSAGNLVIAVQESYARKMTPAGTRLDTAIPLGAAIAADTDGNLYAFANCALYKVDATGQLSVLAGKPYEYGAVDGPGAEARFGILYTCEGRITMVGSNVLVADTGNSVVREVMPSGVVRTVAGKLAQVGMVDGTGPAATFQFGALDMSFDGKDNLYLFSLKVRKITRAGVVTTLNLPERDASQNQINYLTGGMAYQGSLVGVVKGVVYLVEENGSTRSLLTLPQQLEGAAGKADLQGVRSVTHDAAGNYYLLDAYAHFATSADDSTWGEVHIRKITPAGATTTLYTAPYQDAERAPTRIVADKQGNLFAATDGKAILKIAAGGSVSSIPVDLNSNPWLGVDGNGNLFAANRVTLPAIVEKISATGKAEIVAGTRGQFGVLTGELPGSLNQILGMTVDEQGVIYVLTENAVVRIVP